MEDPVNPHTLYPLPPAVTGKLDTLVNLNRDAAKGFAKASGLVDDPVISATFRRSASQREKHVDTLKYRMSLRGVALDDRGGTVGGFLHRQWLPLRSALATQDVIALLEEARRGEEHLLGGYDDALSEVEDDHPLRAELIDQKRRIEACDRQLERILEHLADKPEA
jgi:uncharacterized protein (TIGR02284 family)